MERVPSKFQPDPLKTIGRASATVAKNDRIFSFRGLGGPLTLLCASPSCNTSQPWEWRGYPPSFSLIPLKTLGWESAPVSGCKNVRIFKVLGSASKCSTSQPWDWAGYPECFSLKELGSSVSPGQQIFKARNLLPVTGRKHLSFAGCNLNPSPHPTKPIAGGGRGQDNRYPNPPFLIKGCNFK